MRKELKQFVATKEVVFVQAYLSVLDIFLDSVVLPTPILPDITICFISFKI